MHHEADPLSFEERLRREAQQIASQHIGRGSAAAILAEHRRRARNRRLTGVAAMAVIGVAGAMAAMSRLGSDDPSAPKLAESRVTENGVNRKGSGVCFGQRGRHMATSPAEKDSRPRPAQPRRPRKPPVAENITSADAVTTE
ncbi:MAG: hypothetical protein KY475_20805, partial [Planctomycetes bacterium]|nr:hypothetical protein [Planctomycetota bacterium]